MIHRYSVSFFCSCDLVPKSKIQTKIVFVVMMMLRMMSSANDPFGYNIVGVFWINFNIQMIDHTTEGHDDKQDDNHYVMHRHNHQHDGQKDRLQ
jgi:hypothetical protein